MNLAEYIEESSEAISEFEKAVGEARDRLSARLTEARGAFLGQGVTERLRDRDAPMTKDDYAVRR